MSSTFFFSNFVPFPAHVLIGATLNTFLTSQWVVFGLVSCLCMLCNGVPNRCSHPAANQIYPDVQIRWTELNCSSNLKENLSLSLNRRAVCPELKPDVLCLTSLPQEQALHTVHSVVMLVDKDTSPRPEKHPGLQVKLSNFHVFSPTVGINFLIKPFCLCSPQMDIVTSMKALNKTVEASQLTPDLGGTFPYSHTDWLQFHQVIISLIIIIIIV